MKNLIMNALILIMVSVIPAGLSLGTVSADCPSEGTAGQQILSGVGQTGSKCSSKKVENTIAKAVSILSYVAGVAAVIMIIISGFKYITSGGDSGKVSSAKNTLIYAMVGLAVAALAQFLVQFVLSTTAKA